MSFPFRCPLCHAERMAFEKIKGRRVRCPECSQMVQVESSSWKWDDMQRDTQHSLPTLGFDTTEISDLEAFDPYQQWLAIPPRDRPPNHYELLGLVDFESDPRVIDTAADHQVERVTDRAVERHQPTAQRVLDELAEARAVLLDPDDKAEYDRKLREKRQATSARSSAPPAPAPPPPPSPTRWKEKTQQPSDEPPVVRQPGTRTLTGFQAVQSDEATAVDGDGADDGQKSVDPPRDQPPQLGPVSFGKPSDDRESEMDMTPMVDVTFLLLIFFMVTASFILQKSVETPAQEEDEPSTNVQQMDDFEDNVDYVVVRVDEYNGYRVIYAGWSEDREAPSPHELMRLLRRAREGTELEGRIIRPTKLVVAAHGDAHHNTVIKAIDAGSEVGMEQVQTVLAEEDDYF